MNLSVITAPLSRRIGEADGLAPCATLVVKASSASSTSMAMARTARPCLAEKLRQVSWLKVGMEAVAVWERLTSMEAIEGEYGAVKRKFRSPERRR